MPAAPVRDHLRQEGLDAVDHSADVYAQPEVPVGIAGLEDRPLDADAGIVHQDVEPAIFGLDLLRGGGGRRRGR